MENDKIKELNEDYLNSVQFQINKFKTMDEAMKLFQKENKKRAIFRNIIRMILLLIFVGLGIYGTIKLKYVSEKQINIVAIQLSFSALILASITFIITGLFNDNDKNYELLFTILKSIESSNISTEDIVSSILKVFILDYGKKNIPDKSENNDNLD